MEEQEWVFIGIIKEDDQYEMSDDEKKEIPDKWYEDEY